MPSTTGSSSTTSTNAAIRLLPALVVMAAIYLLSDQPKLPTIPTLSGQITSILGHFFAYFVLAALVWWALGVTGLSPRPRYLAAFAVAVLYGLSDEWHQSFVPGRTPDVFDVLTDAIGAAAGLAAIHIAQRSPRLRRVLT